MSTAILTLVCLAVGGHGRRVTAAAPAAIGALHDSSRRASAVNESKLLAMLVAGLSPAAALKVGCMGQSWRFVTSSSGSSRRASPIGTQSVPVHPGLLSRRAALRCAGLLFGSGACQPAHAYDAQPESMRKGRVVSEEERAKARQERDAIVGAKNSAVAPLVEKVRESKNAEEFDAAMSKLTLWIIGTGPPIPVYMIGEMGPLDGPLPEGFKTREVVKACKTALKALPRYEQKSGQYVEGLGFCEKTRSKASCYSAGPLAETAFKAMMEELEKRAPRQYEEISGSSSLKVWL